MADSSSARQPPPAHSAGNQEAARLDALERYDIRDTEPEPGLDRIARLAAHLFEAPATMINIVADERQWTLSAVGVDGQETGLDGSLCVHTIAEGDRLVVENLAEDDRFAETAFVTDAGFRFYAGVPLITPDDHRIGTLCVLDREPRSPSEAALERLRDLAAMVVDALERRRTPARRAEEQTTRIDGAIQDMTAQHWVERLEEMQGTVFELIATGTETDRVLDELCRFIEEELGGGAVSVLRRTGDTLQHAVAPSLPAEFVNGRDEVPIGPAAGPCGTAAFRGVPVVTRDIRTDDRWDERRGLAEDAGLRSCWAFPILGADEAVLGTFAVYDDVPRRPTAPERNLLRRMAHVASVVLERASQKRALRESEARWRSLVDEHPGPIHVTVDSTFVYANAAAATLFGVEAADELVGEPIFQFAHPDDRDRIRRRARRLTEERRSTPQIEHQIIRRDGVERTVLVQSVPILYEGREAVQTMMWDVTERRRREEQLRRQKALLEQTQRLAGAWRADLQTGAVERSAETRRIYEFEPGVSPDLEEGFSFVPPADRPSFRALFERCIEERASYDLEVPIDTAKGRRRWIRTVGAPVESEEGEVIEVAGAVQDITERKRAERELREWAARLRGLANSIPGVVYQSGPSAEGGRGMWFVGEAAEEVLGLPAETSHFRERFLACIPASHRKDLLNSLDAATDAGAPWRFEVPFDRPDGHRIWILGTATPTQQDGELLYNGVLLDITERKESRRTLERYRVYTGRLLDAIDDLFFVIDEEAQLQRWNDRFLEVTGYTDAEMKHMTAFDFVPEGDQDRLAATIASGFTSGTAQIEVPLVGKDGTTTPYEFIGNLVQHPDGGLRAVGIGRDITERRRRKRQLERQNDLFSKAQTIANVGGWEYALDAEEGTLTDQAHRIYGRSPEEEMTLEGCFLSYHADDRPEVREAFTQAVKEGRPYDLELRLMTEQGEERWIRTRGEPQREDGAVVRVRGTIQDVTEQVERRKELEAAKEAAEEADRIKAALLSNMNHELRTPLTSILTFSKLIHDNPAVADQFIDRIQGGGERLLYTLNTVMDFAELEAGDRALTARSFQLAEVLRSVVNDARERARRKGVALSVDGPDETGAVVLDQYRLERILTHLVHNAVKFTEDGEVTVSAGGEEGVVVVRVADTGVGIAPEFQPRVFDEFAQESSGYDRTHDGNGLGLTVVKRLVDEMDGRIELESEPGNGTRVTVCLPSRRGSGGELGGPR